MPQFLTSHRNIGSNPKNWHSSPLYCPLKNAPFLLGKQWINMGQLWRSDSPWRKLSTPRPHKREREREIIMEKPVCCARAHITYGYKLCIYYVYMYIRSNYKCIILHTSIQIDRGGKGGKLSFQYLCTIMFVSISPQRHISNRPKLESMVKRYNTFFMIPTCCWALKPVPSKSCFFAKMCDCLDYAQTKKHFKYHNKIDILSFSRNIYQLFKMGVIFTSSSAFCTKLVVTLDRCASRLKSKFWPTGFPKAGYEKSVYLHIICIYSIPMYTIPSSSHGDLKS